MTALGNEYNMKVAIYKYFTAGAPNVKLLGIGSLEPSGCAIYQLILGTLGFDQKGECVSNVLPLRRLSNTPTITLTPLQIIGNRRFTIDLDFSKTTMYSGDSSIMPTRVDGYQVGNLVTFNISQDGTIMGIYSNGTQQPIGMLALALFENPGGLKEKEKIYSTNIKFG